MPKQLDFQESKDLVDLEAFLTRAKRLDETGAVKFRCYGDVLAAYVSPIYSGSLIPDGPTVLGLRTIKLAGQSEIDATFQISAILDRLAQTTTQQSTSLLLPDATVKVAWAGVTAPRQGWELVGEIPQEQLSQWAKDGIAEVANTLPESVGSSIAARVRLQIWGRSVGLQYNFPAAAAFAMAGLGFMQKGEVVKLFRTSGWVRLTSQYGHVLSKESFRIS